MNAFTRVYRRQTVTTETEWLGTDPPTASIVTRSVTRYAVTGVAAVSMWGVSQDGRLYVPETVTVDITRGTTPRTTVTGRLLRKDGSLGAAVFEIRRYSHLRSGWPEWLVEIIADAQSFNGGTK